MAGGVENKIWNKSYYVAQWRFFIGKADIFSIFDWKSYLSTTKTYKNDIWLFDSILDIRG